MLADEEYSEPNPTHNGTRAVGGRIMKHTVLTVVIPLVGIALLVGFVWLVAFVATKASRTASK